MREEEMLARGIYKRDGLIFKSAENRMLLGGWEKDNHQSEGALFRTQNVSHGG